MRLSVANAGVVGATRGEDGRTPARCVLMLVSGFPPAREYVLRTVKFAKYLPEWGWTPLIVTPFGKVGVGTEPLVAVPDGVAVKRIPRAPTLSALVAWMRKGRDGGGSGSSVAFGTKTRAISRWFESGARRILLWGDTPDAFAGWIPFAVVAGWWLARRYEVCAIHASGPPFSVVYAGVELSRLTGLPLIADFRDAWTLDSSDPGEFWGPSRMKNRLLRILERRVLRRSRAVLFTSRATRTLYLNEYPMIEAKSHIIYNGADPDDFVGATPGIERATVAHVGTLHDFQWNQVEMFLRGFAQALLAGGVPPDTQLIFAGAIGQKLRLRLEARVRELGIDCFVQVTDFLPHGQAVRWMRGSRVLLLFAGTNPYVRLSKISEYLAAGAYMLAFASGESETAEEVRRYGGRVLSEASEEAVAAALMVAFSTQSDKRSRLQSLEHPHPLNRRTEAQYLADILAKSVAMSGAPGEPSR